ncbi:MAG: nucleotidyltransferase domain-containing protein [Candidatus Woesearchaeota archaeon]
MNILKIFFNEPGREYNVREIARLVNIAPATASKELKHLAKEKILQEREDRVYLLYKANLDSDSYQDLKTYYNIKKLRESGLIDKLNEFYLKPTVVLFGSASFGMDTETSDYDLLVISEKTAEIDLKKFERKLGKKIQLFVFKDMKAINKHLVNNIINGITLQGKLRWT